MKILESQTKFLDDTIQTCNLCKLSKFETNIKFGKMTGFGGGKKYFMVGQNPSNRRSDKLGGHGIYPDFSFSSTPEGLIAKCFNEVNLSWNDFYVTNLVKCSTIENTEPELSIVSLCTDNFLMQEYIVAGCPKKIICLGNFVYDYFIANNVKFLGAHISKVFHHSYIGRYPDKFDEWKRQLKVVINE